MSYTKNGFPAEAASKLNQLRFVNDPTIQELMTAFEAADTSGKVPLIAPTGQVDLDAPCPITRIVAVDGGEAVVPNPLRRERTLAFVNVAALFLKVDDLEAMRADPMMDPREVNRRMANRVWSMPTTLPLAGVRLPNRTVKDTIRALIHAALSPTQTGLGETLKFLVYRQWEAEWPSDVEQPHMNCYSCSENINLPRGAELFRCSSCDHEHTISDYLHISHDLADEFVREGAAALLRNVLEALTIFHFLRKYREDQLNLSQTLFVKDGPLMLRAQLSRLVEPIRAYLKFLHDQGTPVYLVGIEKTGPLVDFLSEFKDKLPEPGQFFLPSVRFLLEEIQGATMTLPYRNRVNFGAKIAVRLGPKHLVPLHIPTGEFLTQPKPANLYGLEEIVRALAKLVSYRYENALIPLVLANGAASISRRPSSQILERFADQLISTPGTGH